MDAFGMSEEMRQQIMGSVSKPAEDFVVMPENWPALQMFLRCCTQWRFSMTGITGLDYTALLNVISITCKKKHREQLFDDVCLIERGALNAIFESRDKDG